MTREEAVNYIEDIKNGLHETGKDFPYRDEVIPVAKEALDIAIKALEQEPRWIPVSEMLPDFNDVVLASTDSNYDESKVIIIVYNADEFWFNGRIKAWMPLPKPYRAESEE